MLKRHDNETRDRHPRRRAAEKPPAERTERAKTGNPERTASTPAAPHGWVLPREDSDGNEVPRVEILQPLPGNDRPVADTALAAALDKVGEAGYAGTGATFIYDHDDRILESRRELRALIQEERRLLSQRQEDAEANNAALSDRQERVRRDRDERIAPLAERETALKDDVARAQLKAGALCAAAGGSFDERSPADGCALCVGKISRELAADELRLPSPTDGVPPLPRDGWACLTIVAGAVVGANLVECSGAATADEILASPLLAAAGTLIGGAILAGGKAAVSLAFGRVGTYRWRGKTTDYRLALAAGCAALAGALGADAALVQSGLLRHLGELADGAARVSLSSGPGISGAADIRCLLVGLVVTGGFLSAAASEGYQRGRQTEITSQADAEIERRFIASLETRRSLPEVREALAALAAVRTLERELAECRAEIARIAADAESEVQRLEGLRADVPHEFDPAARKRLEFARKAYALNLQRWFDQFRHLIVQVEAPPAGWWHRWVSVVRLRFFRWRIWLFKKAED